MRVIQINGHTIDLTDDINISTKDTGLGLRGGWSNDFNVELSKTIIDAFNIEDFTTSSGGNATPKVKGTIFLDGEQYQGWFTLTGYSYKENTASLSFITLDVLGDKMYRVAVEYFNDGEFIKGETPFLAWSNRSQLNQSSWCYNGLNYNWSDHRIESTTEYLQGALPAVPIHTLSGVYTPSYPSIQSIATSLGYTVNVPSDLMEQRRYWCCYSPHKLYCNPYNTLYKWGVYNYTRVEDNPSTNYMPHLGDSAYVEDGELVACVTQYHNSTVGQSYTGNLAILTFALRYDTDNMSLYVGKTYDGSNITSPDNNKSGICVGAILPDGTKLRLYEGIHRADDIPANSSFDLDPINPSSTDADYRYRGLANEYNDLYIDSTTLGQQRVIRERYDYPSNTDNVGNSYGSSRLINLTATNYPELIGYFPAGTKIVVYDRHLVMGTNLMLGMSYAMHFDVSPWVTPEAKPMNTDISERDNIDYTLKRGVNNAALVRTKGCGFFEFMEPKSQNNVGSIYTNRNYFHDAYIDRVAHEVFGIPADHAIDPLNTTDFGAYPYFYERYLPAMFQYNIYMADVSMIELFFAFAQHNAAMSVGRPCYDVNYTITFPGAEGDVVDNATYHNDVIDRIVLDGEWVGRNNYVELLNARDPIYAARSEQDETVVNLNINDIVNINNNAGTDIAYIGRPMQIDEENDNNFWIERQTGNNEWEFNIQPRVNPDTEGVLMVCVEYGSMLGAYTNIYRACSLLQQYGTGSGSDNGEPLGRKVWTSLRQTQLSSNIGAELTTDQMSQNQLVIVEGRLYKIVQVDTDGTEYQLMLQLYR